MQGKIFYNNQFIPSRYFVRTLLYLNAFNKNMMVSLLPTSFEGKTKQHNHAAETKLEQQLRVNF
jgi:hypothetical protein